MKYKDPKISVILPVYNEEKHIVDCLNALNNQTYQAYEIIVVDNNCIDQTMALARKFTNVKIITESRQGRGYAQTAGFNAAEGEILARIDADTIVGKKWLADIVEVFNIYDCDAVTGYGYSRTGINWGFVSKIFSWSYYNWGRAYYGIETLWGSNMAFSREIWQKASKYCLSTDNSTHEDIDMALAISSVGGVIKVAPCISVSVDFKAVLSIARYHNMLKMCKTIKVLDKNSPRYLLPFRIKLNWLNRFYYQLISYGFVVLFYFVCAVYSLFSKVAGYFKSGTYYLMPQKIK